MINNSLKTWTHKNRESLRDKKAFYASVSECMSQLRVAEKIRANKKSNSIISRANNHIEKAIQLIEEYEQGLASEDPLLNRTRESVNSLLFCSKDLESIKEEAKCFERRINKTTDDLLLLFKNEHSQFMDRIMGEVRLCNEYKELDSESPDYDKNLESIIADILKEDSFIDDYQEKQKDMLKKSYGVAIKYGDYMHTKKNNYETFIEEVISLYEDSYLGNEIKINGAGDFFSLIKSCFYDMRIIISDDAILKYIRQTHAKYHGNNL